MDKRGHANCTHASTFFENFVTDSGEISDKRRIQNSIFNFRNNAFSRSRRPTLPWRPKVPRIMPKLRVFREFCCNFGRLRMLGNLSGLGICSKVAIFLDFSLCIAIARWSFLYFSNVFRTRPTASPRNFSIML